MTWLTEEPQTLSRGAAIGDEVYAIGFTRVDRGRRATARKATIRESTQLTYDPLKVVKKHPGWILAIEGDPITDGFSGGPVIDARTGMVIGVLGLRGTGTADAIAISNLAAWRDAPPAVSPIRDEVAALRQSARTARGSAVVLGLALAAASAVLALRTPVTRIQGPISVFPQPPPKPDPDPERERQRSEVVFVQAAAGWQVSNTAWKAGDTLCLAPSGQVHVAMNEIYNLAQLGRQILATYAAAGTKLATFRNQFGAPTFTESNRFRRSWSGAAGNRGVRDGLLDDCLLRASSGWGALLVVEVPSEDDPNYEERDPLEVLDAIDVKIDAVKTLSTGRGHVMSRDGKLAFIVNDAVLSELSTQAICREAFASLGAARAAKARDLSHQLDLDPLALFPYLDNYGEFRVRVTFGDCTNATAMMMRPTRDGGTDDAAPVDAAPKSTVPLPLPPTLPIIPPRRTP